MKMSEIRNLSSEERKAKLQEIRQDLMHERGMSAMGGSTRSPGKIRKLRTGIARILTVEREEELKNS